MDNTNTISDVINSLTTREEITLAYSLLKARSNTVNILTSASTVANITNGTRVKLQGLSPKYVNGKTGTVMSIKGLKIQIRLDESIGRFSKAVPVTVSAASVTII